jgi:hypothetical protein
MHSLLSQSAICCIAATNCHGAADRVRWTIHDRSRFLLFKRGTPGHEAPVIETCMGSGAFFDEEVGRRTAGRNLTPTWNIIK